MREPSVLSPDHLHGLGELAYHAAQLEFTVEVLLNEMIDENPAVGAVLTAGWSFSVRLQRITGLLPLRDEDTLFTPLMRDHLIWAKESMEERNRLLHSRWIGRSGEEPVQARGKTHTSRTLWEVTAEDLFDAARRMAGVVRALEIDWAGYVLRVGRTTPVAGKPGFVYTPDRWSVEGDVKPAHSRSKTDLDLYVEGKIDWSEYQRRESLAL
jgi:hypothetical protein